MRARVLLLMPTTTYKAQDFLKAAARLDVEVVVGTERRQALETQAPGYTLKLDFTRPEQSVHEIVELDRTLGLDAVIGVDDETTVLAARAARALGLPHNAVGAAEATRNKHRARQALAAAGVRCPTFRCFSVEALAEEAAGGVGYPCVLKPLSLSASRGVLRVDDAEGFVAAFHRIAAILARPDVRSKGGDSGQILAEDYIPGAEVAVEGLLTGGTLRLLAVFDKPDPLEGPTFEETIYVTPSRLARRIQQAVAHETARGCAALGLSEGPVHAELRVRNGEPWLLEVAARTIGGLCSRTLRFGAGRSLEELVLSHALGLDLAEVEREAGAAGVMMIPIPAAGVLVEVSGLEEARRLPGVDQVVISVNRGALLEPLPEGNRYLGFVFARGETPEAVEATLRGAHGRLSFRIEPAPDSS